MKTDYTEIALLCLDEIHSQSGETEQLIILLSFYFPSLNVAKTFIATLFRYNGYIPCLPRRHYFMGRKRSYKIIDSLYNTFDLLRFAIEPNQLN